MNYPILLLSNALILGFRHGLDLDHIAAITDITSTTNNNSANFKPLLFASMYALGHAFIVASLGLGALYFTLILPQWIDPIMERVVGFTLIALGLIVLLSMIQNFKHKGTFKLQSRWMIILKYWEKIHNWLYFKLFNIKAKKPANIIKYGLQASFFIGILHGLGAETGSQILIITSIGGIKENNLAIIMLFAFVTGLLISNTLIAIISKTAFINSKKLNYIYIVLGILTFSFNIIIGLHFILGKASNLPSLT